MNNLISLRKVAKDLGIDAGTVKRWCEQNNCLFKTKNTKKTGKGSGQICYAVDKDNAEKFKKQRLSETSELADSEFTKIVDHGCFYFIQVIPDFTPNRIKLGFSDNLTQRIGSFKTVIPTLKVVKTWPCLRCWERAAIASVTRMNCIFIGEEIIDCDSYELILQRCDEFFSIMPVVL